MNLYDYFLNLESTSKILSKDHLKLKGSTDDYNQMLVLTDFYSSNKTIFVVLPNLYQAQKYYDALASYANEEDVLFFPADEMLTTEMLGATGDFLFERIQTLYTLIKNPKKIVITNMHGAIHYEMPKSKWESSIFTIDNKTTMSPNELAHKLSELGYEPTYQAVKTGQFAKRGSIVDIFALGYDHPFRIDFFGDDVDTIKTFNPDTQRSISSVDSIDILPVSEFIYDNEDFKYAKDKILSFMDQYKLSLLEEEIYKKDLFNLEQHKSLDTMSRYLGFFNESISPIFDYVDDKRIYLIDPIKAKEEYERIILDLNEYCGRIGGYSIASMKLYYNLNNIIDNGNVLIEGLRSLSDYDYSISCESIVPFKAKKDEIVKDFYKYKANCKKVIVSITDEDKFKKLYDLLLENNLFLNKISDLKNAKFELINCINRNTPSFELKDENLVLINEATLFNVDSNPKKVKYKSIYKNAQKISNYDELCIGDYVVHYDYGIGKYTGIKTIKTQDFERDYLQILYKDNASLYVPLEQIKNIMKYASADTEGVEMNSLNGTQWAKAKARVRKRVHDISQKLISLYAQRSQAKGFAFEADTVEQQQFENDFKYELTPDQKKAVMDVKKDMESPKPMDRLICGDVGYGKTEVAMRAAFKAVYGGKQVCVLAPTTILARQHYMNFKARMEDYGIRVELLSRFVPLKQQKKIIEDTLKGGVDVLIGTHRVLSSEIKYKDLGLLVIDEEQRFGVTHKEKIKELKVNVDCITLSATPIPRTLQMSIMGLKDLSMIETPPKNRYPIQTYVVERNDHIIADAIMKEMVRGGQVFYLYNFVDGIEEVASHIHELVPEARIAIGHGKLSKDKLEEVFTDYIDKKYDVLLCTTIIETGIDMPDTNTLIIHDADRLGLSQMYQIRGRVGRSNKIAYAYLMYEPRKVLTPQAEKRLETIKEFNELGSGIKIAMRDLSIRGSGDLLGEEQSGFVESVGIDMYMRILDEELNKPKEEKKYDPSLSTPLTNSTIKETYINNDDARISIHKKIASIKNIKEMNDLVNELTDRFGKVDNDLQLYMYDRVIKNTCKDIGIDKIEKSANKSIHFIITADGRPIDGVKLYQSSIMYKRISLTFIKNEVHIMLDITDGNRLEAFKEILNYFDKIR